MFRCQGYYGVPSHYQIPMCYYGRWSAQLFSSCKLTHWRHGPEANDVFDFTSIVNPNVQAYKTFTQRSTPYVDGGNVFVRVFKFPDVGDGQGEFVWKKYHFDFFLTNSGIIMKGAFNEVHTTTTTCCYRCEKSICLTPRAVEERFGIARN